MREDTCIFLLSQMLLVTRRVTQAVLSVVPVIADLITELGSHIMSFGIRLQHNIHV